MLGGEILKALAESSESERRWQRATSLEFLRSVCEARQCKQSRPSDTQSWKDPMTIAVLYSSGPCSFGLCFGNFGTQVEMHVR